MEIDQRAPDATSTSFKVSDAELRTKLGHIVGFKIDDDLDFDSLLELLKDESALDILNEVQRAIE